MHVYIYIYIYILKRIKYLSFSQLSSTQIAVISRAFRVCARVYETESLLFKMDKVEHLKRFSATNFYSQNQPSRVRVYSMDDDDENENERNATSESTIQKRRARRQRHGLVRFLFSF